jgi:diadenosine tetraphosphate (Ap4A) HIT family hydrolase
MCAMATSDSDAVVYKDDQWTASTVMDVPGWILFCVNRHAEGIWSLTPDEAAAFGTLAQRIGSAVREVCGSARVYLLVFGENVLHFHAMIQGRGDDVPESSRSGAMLSHAADFADREAAAKVGQAVRELLATA